MRRRRRLRTSLPLVVGLLVALVGRASISAPGVMTAGPPLAVALSTPPPAVQRADPPTHARAEAAYGRLPVSFEANHGQADASVQFLARGRGYQLSLTATEAVFVLRPPAVPPLGKAARAAGRTGEARPTAGPPTVVRMQLVGAQPTPPVAGKAALPGRVHYIRGEDPAQWRTSIPTYAHVRYPGVYPGIDLVYHGRQGALEYDFHVAPSADPTAITLAFEGVQDLTVDAQGDLVLHTAAGELRQRRPVLYQEGPEGRQAVTGGYVLRGARHIGLAIGPYDPSRPLVIDPVIVYTSFLGGSMGDRAVSIAVDTAGHAYVAGWDGSERAIFVTKVDPTGSTRLYTTYIKSGYILSDVAEKITLDAAGNVLMTGGRGWLGALVAKLDPAGMILYLKHFGGGMDVGYGIAADAGGNAYVTGEFWITRRLPVTPGAFQPTPGGGNMDGFVMKLSPEGAIVYASYLGGGGDDRGRSIAVDADGHAYVTGTTASVNFPTTPSAFQETSGGWQDAFVTKVNPQGSALVYSTLLGGCEPDEGRAIAVDPVGQAYVTGSTGRPLACPDDSFPVHNAFQDEHGGAPSNAFITKLTADGSALVYSTFFGSGGEEYTGDIAHGIAVNAAGDAYVIGGTSTACIFPMRCFPIKEAWQPERRGTADAFVAKLSPTGQLVFSSYHGGRYRDWGFGIAMDAHGYIYVVGETSSDDFPTTSGAFQPEWGGGTCSSLGCMLDGFLTKIAD